MPEVTLRPAIRSDAADLALLENLAGHGISLWFWQDECESGSVEDALALGRQKLADPNSFYGFCNAEVAIRDECIIGSVTSYIMPAPDEESEKIKKNASAFTPVFDLFEVAEGHWFIDSLAVYPDARGDRIGNQLLASALRKGEMSDAETVSLVVENTNSHALKIYEAHGFNCHDTREFVEFRGPSDTKQWLLLSRPCR